MRQYVQGMNKIQFRIEQCSGVLSMHQLEEVLRNLPLNLKTTMGRRLPVATDTFKTLSENPTILIADHDAQLISLKPRAGGRIYDGSFDGGRRQTFAPSRVFDETGGNGETNSYSFDTKDLGLDFSQELMLDIHKYGGELDVRKYFKR